MKVRIYLLVPFLFSLLGVFFVLVHRLEILELLVFPPPYFASMLYAEGGSLYAHCFVMGFIYFLVGAIADVSILLFLTIWKKFSHKLQMKGK